MDKISSDDLGTFRVLTRSGTEYILSRQAYGKTVLRKNAPAEATQIGQFVSIINCTVNEPAIFGLFPDKENPENYYLYHTSPVVEIILLPNKNNEPLSSA